MRTAHALAWLTLDLIRRLLREPQIVRSMLWPIMLVPITVMVTVFAWVWVEGHWPVGVGPDTPPGLVQHLERTYTVVPVDDAREAVLTGGFRYATDGEKLFVVAARGRALQVEREMRRYAGADWYLARQPDPVTSDRRGGTVMYVIGVMFVLFGVVFGAGMVARDRDDGTLEAQLATGTPRWIHGTARLLAGTFVLFLHYEVAVLVMNAILGIESQGTVARKGLAACISGVSIGLLVIGRGGLKNGFSTPLASGITATTVLMVGGLAAPEVGRNLPIASLLVPTPGWTALYTSSLLGAAAVAVFTTRSARA